MTQEMRLALSAEGIGKIRLYLNSQLQSSNVPDKFEKTMSLLKTAYAGLGSVSTATVPCKQMADLQFEIKKFLTILALERHVQISKVIMKS